jgi:transcriptional regulator with XRE-family HTH domain
LAELVGAQQPSIAQLESGAMQPSIRFLRKLAAALDAQVAATLAPRQQLS